jgi:hypothetical protein
VFFARFDREATWLDELRPAQGETEFFFQPHLRRMHREPDVLRRSWRSRGQDRPDRGAIRPTRWIAPS